MFERAKQGAVDVVRGPDPLTGDNVAGLSVILEECAAHRQPHVILDLSRVPLIDSAGLELLLDASEQYMKCGGALKLASPNGLCRDILAVSGLNGRMEVFNDVIAAAGSFSR